MMPAWHQLVPISGHVEESETARKLQLYATSIKTSVSTRLSRWEKIRKNDFAPSEKFSCYAPDVKCKSGTALSSTSTKIAVRILAS